MALSDSERQKLVLGLVGLLGGGAALGVNVWFETSSPDKPLELVLELVFDMLRVGMLVFAVLSLRKHGRPLPGLVELAIVCQLPWILVGSRVGTGIEFWLAYHYLAAGLFVAGLGSFLLWLRPAVAANGRLASLARLDRGLRIYPAFVVLACVGTLTDVFLPASPSEVLGAVWNALPYVEVGSLTYGFAIVLATAVAVFGYLYWVSIASMWSLTRKDGGQAIEAPGPSWPSLLLALPILTAVVIVAWVLSSS